MSRGRRLKRLLVVLVLTFALAFAFLSFLHEVFVGWPNTRDCSYGVDGQLPQHADCVWSHISGPDTGLSVIEQGSVFHVEIVNGLQAWQRNPYGLAPIQFGTANGWLLEARFKINASPSQDTWPTWDNWTVAFSQFSTTPPHESWNLIVVLNRTQFKVVLSNSTTYTGLAVESGSYAIGDYHTMRYVGVPCGDCTGSRKIMEFQLFVDGNLVGKTGDTWKIAPDAARISVRNYSARLSVDFDYWMYQLHGESP